MATVDHLLTDSEILSKNKTKSLLLTKIEIENGENFTDHFFDKLLSPLLESSDFTTDQLITGSKLTFKNLSNTGVFDNVKINILDDSFSEKSNKDLEKPEVKVIKPLTVKALITLTPKKLISTNFHSIFYDDGNSMGIKYENLNCFGNAESFQSMLEFDLRDNLKLIDLQFRSPLAASTSLFLNGLMLNNVNQYASHKQILFDTMIGLQKTNFIQFNDLYYRSILIGGLLVNRRTVTNVSDSASDIIKSNSGDSLKKSVILSGALDSRSYLSPKSLFPISGSLIKIDNEISSTDGNGNFIKSVIQLENFTNFFNNSLILQLDSSFGGIQSLSNKQKFHIQDKFFQGGLQSLQGFLKNSTGLRDGNDYIGGNFFYNFKLSMLSKLPFVSADCPIRFVQFINFGDVFENLNVLQLKLPKDIKSKQDWQKFFISENSTNIGVGLLYKFGTDAHLNMNYNFPLSTRVNDIRKPGLEFSLSLLSDF